jgi:signal transduction histidine kinase/CheY-like chemotaxis protein/HAMP domain-containing protein
LQTDVEDDFFTLYNEGIESAFRNQRLQAKNIDFILEKSDKPEDNFLRYVVKQDIYLPERIFNLKEFLNYNPYVILMSFEGSDSRKYVYGKVINTEMLDNLSQRINADIALVWNGNSVDISNQVLNQNYIYILTQAVENLKGKNNFELYLQGTESNDILATIYKPTSIDKQDNLHFLIFATFAEAGELRSTLKSVFLIIGFVGIALSLIFTFLFTDRIRKQITELSRATEQTHWGKYDNKINVKSKDEIGKLGLAFNRMLDDLEKKEVAKNEYAEFITLINRNPSLKEISDVALKKILDSCDFLIGGLYSIDNQVTLISSYGLANKNENQSEFSEFIKKVIENKQSLELFDENTLPLVSTGLLDIKVKYLLFLPILYNDKPVALLELGSLNKPSEEVRDYLEKIKDQLAIGITNAKALSQLENLVIKLKQLNEEYHKQNVQIKEQNETLLQLHNELKLQTEELEKQKQKALNLTEVKSKFLANMSHELRTPMNSILGLTELMLEKGYLEPRNKERLEVVLNSGKRLMALINDILDLSKIEAGKIEIRNEAVLLSEILEEISGSIAPLANEKGIGYKVVKNLDTHSVINTDRGKVVQVLINLLGNAVKYTDLGEVVLKVSVVNEMLNFEVIDTGIGISEEEIKVIFEEFRQLNSSKLKRHAGTGLGLAISKKFADILGGSLIAESELNKGSTFIFSVPFMQIESSMPEPKGKVNFKALLKNRKNPILVIDDEEEVRFTIGQYLLSIGYEVIYAEDGEKGLKMAVDNQPFAIILDILLPGLDGWSVIKELKQIPQTKNIPVILISIIANKNFGYSLGAFEYLVKPISSERLLTAFSKLENLANKKIQKIVIVDDDELEFQKYKEELASDKIKIEFIKESKYAFNKISEIQPDLIIVDLMMSKVDGITLSHKLKSSINTRHIPIIISTAKDISEEEKKSLANIVEDITVKSKGHPNDVLRVVKDRIEMQEKATLADIPENGNSNKAETKEIKFLKNETKVEQSLGIEVLIVDDDPDTLFTLDEIVQSCKCNTVLAKNGKECLEILERKIPDLVLMDIIMPEMDGFQTIKQIRKNKKWADLPVFAVTAQAMKEDNEIILKHGFSDYVPKPVNPSIVSAKIQKLITQLKTI